MADQAPHLDARPADPLSVPRVAHRHFRRNFIKNAVCELRFPTLHDIDQPTPPLRFAKALRHEYPNQGLMSGIELVANGMQKSSGHSFRSKKDRWAVTLRSSTLSLETVGYDTFDDFEMRIEHLIEASKTFIDSDFFTRVGIRYVNALPYEKSNLSKWINPELVRPLAVDAFGDVKECTQQIRGTTTDGQYFFQHGLGGDGGERRYVIDLDFYSEDLTVADTMATVRELHARLFDLFMWAIGPAAVKAMEGGTLSAR